ncbi:hypothetical protein QBC46DRAFT_422013 [Diplogelasinospora grovesii]|uniref:Uncharacterized protein n=1 Tax=Diplogelasinospora grovesii TaxID=303347 RepID=A0AAN6N0I9_9PEZI|nr:hypothetical protein QBC46DRAFT_422013 [Diplogelasinospora grovesii]
MSSPGQIAEPNARPQSTLLPSSGSRPGSHLKAYGQDYRFAETYDNPAPELVVGDGQGVQAAQGDGPRQDSGGDTGENSKEVIFRNVDWDGTTPKDPKKPWYKRLSTNWWAIIVVSIVGVAGVILAVLGALNMLVNPSHSSSSPTATSSSSGSSTPSATISSAGSSLPKPTGGPSVCSNTSSFVQGASWMGIAGTNNWHVHFDQSTSDQACCTACYTKNPGCNGWMYNSTSPYTPCAMIVGSDSSPNADSTCPVGYAPSTTFALGGDQVAGVGPCSLEQSSG